MVWEVEKLKMRRNTGDDLVGRDVDGLEVKGIIWCRSAGLDSPKCTGRFIIHPRISRN
jgi:hypothetical protein